MENTVHVAGTSKKDRSVLKASDMLRGGASSKIFLATERMKDKLGGFIPCACARGNYDA